MATCYYCETLFFFGGKSDATGRYCNAKCQAAGNLLARSRQIPAGEVERLVRETHHSNCPRCGGHGPIDIHKAHQVWSAIFITSWSSKPELSCKSCATKRQIISSITSLLFGWWGFPWGLGMTPLQVARNIIEIAGGPQPNNPTPLLEKYIRLNAAAQLARTSRPQFPPSLCQIPSIRKAPGLPNRKAKSDTCQNPSR